MTLNPNQFGEQLAMFMSPNEVIENVHKNDTFLRGNYTPREQWEEPATRGIGETRVTESLRDTKAGELKTSWAYADAKPSTMGPLEITQQSYGPSLTDGHHRLAFAEEHKMPWVPVRHQQGWR